MRNSFAKNTGITQQGDNIAKRQVIDLLALQGGGSHGAFTAGVLSSLQKLGYLEDVREISGASAGAVNAVPLAYGLNKGDSALAIAMVNEIWDGVARSGQHNHLTDTFFRNAHNFASMMTMYTPMHRPPVKYPNLAEDAVSFSKCVMEMGSNLGIISQAGDIKKRMQVIPDWDVIRNGKVKLSLATSLVTKDKNGMTHYIPNIVTQDKVNSDAVAASAALIGGHIFQGKLHVDGGYVANPPLDVAGKGKTILAIMLSPRPNRPLRPIPQNDAISHTDFLHDEAWDHLEYLRQQGHNVEVIELPHNLHLHMNESSKLNYSTRFINDLRNAGALEMVEWHKAFGAKFGQGHSLTQSNIDEDVNYDLDNTRCAVA